MTLLAVSKSSLQVYVDAKARYDTAREEYNAVAARVKEAGLPVPAVFDFNMDTTDKPLIGELCGCWIRSADASDCREEAAHNLAASAVPWTFCGTFVQADADDKLIDDYVEKRDRWSKRLFTELRSGDWLDNNRDHPDYASRMEEYLTTLNEDNDDFGAFRKAALALAEAIRRSTVARSTT